MTVSRQMRSHHARASSRSSEDQAGSSMDGAQARAGDAAIARMASSGRTEADPFPPGTEVWVHRQLGYHHAGVYVGGGEVVQVTAEPMDTVKALLHGRDHFPTIITKVSLAKFAKGGRVVEGPDGTAADPAAAIQRAQSMLGAQWEYDPLENNCQHFASWCVTGVPTSPEARAFQHALDEAAHAPQHAAGGIAGTVGSAAGTVGQAVGDLFHHIA